ncbi:hypothetical protein M408DRAFT_27920 [Serendipita vermifera MAFF 305830]|uniref:Uncharacterized protein n=1 Tax=Serendipita vermifera MAFF 305830 TaxID=933852 RepID=A0A0C2WA91_SERVB|nr:hypothetical protein M408DRAFT_27920 [Serendipita vermifera MAFF 305830]
MDEAIELILHGIGHSGPTSEQERNDAENIAKALDCLPIALQQARSYMRETRCSASSYLERLLASRDRLLSQPVKYQLGMRYLSTYAAFEASYERLEQRAQQMLQFLSCFHWSRFPLEAITEAAKFNFSDYELEYNDHGEEYHVARAILRDLFLRDGQWNILDLDKLMISLQTYSLITLTPGADTKLLEIHPVLHQWVNSCLLAQDKPRYQSAAILLLALNARFDYTPARQYLSGHVMHLAPLWSRMHINDVIAFGLILKNGALYEDASRLLERSINELRGEGESEPILTDVLWQLAIVYRCCGKLNEALLINEELLKAWKIHQGDRHPNTINATSNLAIVYHELGRLKEALDLHEHALNLSKEIFGEKDALTLMLFGNLGTVYSDSGRLKDALMIREETLKLHEEVLGNQHPDTVEESPSSRIWDGFWGDPKGR